MLNSDIIIRPLRYQEYTITWRAMQTFTDTRAIDTVDEIWLIEHPPVYTLGQAGKMEHVLNPGDIPVIAVDRGGQVTYHGPGQLVVYFLLDIGRRGISVRELVSALEQSIVTMLAKFNITAYPRNDAPGVYVQDAKICSIGLRIRKGCSYHGLALNVAMDLTPFSGINPCGFKNMPITQIADQGGPRKLTQVAPVLVQHLLEKLGYTKPDFAEPLSANAEHGLI